MVLQRLVLLLLLVAAGSCLPQHFHRKRFGRHRGGSFIGGPGVGGRFGSGPGVVIIGGSGGGLGLSPVGFHNGGSFHNGGLSNRFNNRFNNGFNNGGIHNGGGGGLVVVPQGGVSTGGATANVVNAQNTSPFGTTGINGVSANAGGTVVGNGASFNNAQATSLQLTGPFGTGLSFSNTGATSNQFGG